MINPADGLGTMDEMRVAIVDVGANTLRLLVAVSDGPGIQPVHVEREQLGLGEEVERCGYIGEMKCAQAVEVARAQARRALRLGCERIEILVTSPGRQSANGQDFAEALRRGTGVPARILSAEEEGTLAWEGAVAALQEPPESIAVCDVGGGSTQVAVGTTGAGVAWVRSVDLGSRRLTTRLLAGGSPSPETVAAARAAAAEAFSGLVPPAARCALAAGGSARALRRVVGTLDADGLTEAVDMLSRLKRSKVTKRYGISPQRAETLLAGAILLAELQTRLGLTFELAAGGVREGFALTLFRESAAAYA